MTMRMALPPEIAQASAGFTRAFYVIRGHEDINGVNTAKRIALAQDGDVWIFENDRFSSFTIVYEDIPNQIIGAPQTGVMTSESGSVSNDLWGMMYIGAAVVLAFGAVKFARIRR